MNERRQAYRREPIEIDLGGDVIISIGPVSWMRRNDFGNEVMRQHSQLLNEAVKIYLEENIEDAVPQLEAKFGDKFKDPYPLLELGLDEATYLTVKELDLTFEQIITILLTICDVNKLDQLHPLLDPNSQAPTPIGGLISNLVSGEQATQKTESSPDSSSLESNELLSTT